MFMKIHKRMRARRFHPHRTLGGDHYHRHPGGDRHPDLPGSAQQSQRRCCQIPRPQRHDRHRIPLADNRTFEDMAAADLMAIEPSITFQAGTRLPGRYRRRCGPEPVAYTGDDDDTYQVGTNSQVRRRRSGSTLTRRQAGATLL